MKSTNLTDELFGARIRLFNMGSFVFTATPFYLLFLFLILLSLRFRLFPLFYSSFSTVEYWAAAVLTTIGIFVSVLLHEIAHVGTARVLGGHPHGSLLYVFGTGTPLELPHSERWARTLLAANGVAFSLLLSLLLVGSAFVAEKLGAKQFPIAVFFHLAAFNLSLSLFQLLPALPLDGGRILLNVFQKEGSLQTWPTNLCYLLGVIISAVFLYVGVHEIVLGRNVLGLWLCLLGLLLFRVNGREYDYLRIREKLLGRSIFEFANTNPTTVNALLGLDEFRTHFLDKYSFQAFPVLEEGQLVGIVYRKSLGYLKTRIRRRQIVRELSQPLGPENTVPPDKDAARVLSLMTHTGNSRLLIVDGKRLVGMVSYGDFVRGLKRNLANQDSGGSERKKYALSENAERIEHSDQRIRVT